MGCPRRASADASRPRLRAAVALEAAQVARDAAKAAEEPGEDEDVLVERVEVSSQVAW